MRVREKQADRIESVITLRAIAALLVCMVHIGLIAGFRTTGILQMIINHGALGVELFFVISGFVLPYSLFKAGYVFKDFFKFLVGRLVRIDPPYWASIIILFFLGLQLAPITLTSLLLHLTYLVPFIPGARWYSDIYWTLAIEFQYYMVIGLVYPVLTRLKPKLATVVVLVPAAICMVLKLNYRGVSVTHLYDFAVGYLCYMWFIKAISKNFFIICLLLFCVFIMLGVSVKTGTIPFIKNILHSSHSCF